MLNYQHVSPPNVHGFISKQMFLDFGLKLSGPHCQVSVLIVWYYGTVPVPAFASKLKLQLQIKINVCVSKQSTQKRTGGEPIVLVNGLKIASNEQESLRHFQAVLHVYFVLVLDGYILG